MASLRAIIGMYPKTSEIEARRSALIKEFNDFKDFEQSDELKEYYELEKLIRSPEFSQRKMHIKSRKYKDTDEYRKEQEYRQLKKASDIKLYYKTKNSQQLQDFKWFDRSDELKKLKDLEDYLKSEEYFRIKNFMKLPRRKREKISDKPTEALSFKETDAYRKLQEYKALKSSKPAKDYFKFKNSKAYNNYKHLDSSERIARFEELEKYLQTDEFKNKKDYMLLSPGEKLKLSDEYKKEQNYEELKKSDKFVWYFKLKGSDKFDDLKRWKITFEDDFSTPKLDRGKWNTRYFWGEVLMNEGYAQAGEKHFFTDKDNFEISDSVLKIITRKEKASGKEWNATIGFFEKEFDYTSGLINTGNSFRQQYGIFEAKIRIGKSYPVNHAFWMLSDHITPHIDVMKAEKKLKMNFFWGDVNQPGRIRRKSSGLGISRFTDDYYIYSLEWNQERITWKINGVKVASANRNLPKSPMYINFSSGLYKDANGTVLPAVFEIDWVRCYQRADRE